MRRAGALSRLALAICLALRASGSVAAPCMQDILAGEVRVDADHTWTVGLPVEVKARKADRVLVLNALGQEAWIPSRSVVSTRRFMPVDPWLHEDKLEAGDGDYEATYHVNRDGTFSVEETDFVAKTETYRMVTRRGRFYGWGQLFWARRPGECLYSSRVFVKASNGRMCWQGYMDGRCGRGP